MVKVYFFRFRPSSHSEEFTITANLPSVEKAKQLYSQLVANADKLPLAEHGQSIVRSKQTVSLDLYVPGPDEVVKLVRTIKRKNKGAKCEIAEERTSFIIETEIPEGLTLDSPILPLILDSEAYKALKELKKFCQTEQKGSKIIFRYDGEDANLFYDKYGLLAGGRWIVEKVKEDICIIIPEDWKVKRHAIEPEDWEATFF